MLAAGIVLYKTDRTHLARLLSCVNRSVISRVYVVDNSPTDQLAEAVRPYEKAVYIHGHGNVGYGRGNNIALRLSLEAGSRYHIVMNPDIYFDEQAVARLWDFMEANPEAGAVMPKILYPDGTVQFLCRMLPVPSDLLMRRFCSFRGAVEKMNERIELRRSGYDHVMNVPCLSGCFMFLRSQALREVGLFDERYFLYGEDFDLYRRLHARFETLFYPHVSVFHEYDRGSYRSRGLLFTHIVSMVRYFNKWGWIFDRECRVVNRRILGQFRAEESFSPEETPRAGDNPPT